MLFPWVPEPVEGPFQSTTSHKLLIKQLINNLLWVIILLQNPSPKAIPTR